MKNTLGFDVKVDAKKTIKLKLLSKFLLPKYLTPIYSQIQLRKQFKREFFNEFAHCRLVLVGRFYSNNSENDRFTKHVW